MSNRLKPLLIIFGFSAALMVFAAGCGRMPLVKHREHLMGTTVDVTVHHPDARAAEDAVSLAFREAARLEGLLSAYIDESDVSGINKNAGVQPAVVAPETFYVIRQAVKYSKLSGGAFDVTVMPLVELWSGAALRGELPSEREILEAGALVDFREIILDEKNSSVMLGKKGMRLDLGAIAKGFVVDKMAEILRDAGMRGALVNAGGDIYAHGTSYGGEGWRIGLRHPRSPERVVDVFSVTNRAVATSGDYERFFIYEGVRYSHIIDPRSGMPARGVISATVLAGTCLEADALATILFVTGYADGRPIIEELGAEAVLFNEDWEYGDEKRI